MTSGLDPEHVERLVQRCENAADRIEAAVREVSERAARIEELIGRISAREEPDAPAPPSGGQTVPLQNVGWLNLSDVRLNVAELYDANIAQDAARIDLGEVTDVTTKQSTLFVDASPIREGLTLRIDLAGGEDFPVGRPMGEEDFPVGR
jgi:hypothetical protein